LPPLPVLVKVIVVLAVNDLKSSACRQTGFRCTDAIHVERLNVEIPKFDK
jgi:hypothetical protein